MNNKQMIIYNHHIIIAERLIYLVRKKIDVAIVMVDGMTEECFLLIMTNKESLTII